VGEGEEEVMLRLKGVSVGIQAEGRISWAHTSVDCLTRGGPRAREAAQ
jgi:hypothetical protein